MRRSTSRGTKPCFFPFLAVRLDLLVDETAQLRAQRLVFLAEIGGGQR